MTDKIVKYETVVFIDGDESDEAFNILYEEGGASLFQYLLQWEDGEGREQYNSPPWGSSDIPVHWREGKQEYVLSYNWNLAYVSLTRIVEG